MPLPTSLPADLAASFARRVAERDVVRPPEPPSQTPEAIAQRLAHWLETTHHVRDYRARAAFAQLLLHLLAHPEAPTAALTSAAGLGPRMTARHLLRLAEWGLAEWFYRGRTRYHRLTRSGEDALLPVVTGAGA
ncbi:hypothetical protein [Hymenobacter cheonanensis]|uniref:hypothetical protein n=1 Tax=Hymenobacter sp. CA2-7 TaxID=3063993 RepID=UPI002713FC5F|nr:hypothetical protein [Hymenobacter sp. CA2-7]MDO7887137.1 hypothetical protein [Hymenobacter sp. CA2-7]